MMPEAEVGSSVGSMGAGGTSPVSKAGGKELFGIIYFALFFCVKEHTL